MVIENKVCPKCGGRVGMIPSDIPFFPLFDNIVSASPPGTFAWMCENNCFMGTFTFEGIDDYLEELRIEDEQKE